MKLPGFIGGAYMARSRAFDAQRCVNLYPEVSESGASKHVAMLVGTPGLALWATIPAEGGVRGLIRFSATLAVVLVGREVYVVDSAAVATRVGSIASSDGPVSMASNGTLVCIADGEALHFVDPVAKTIVGNPAYPASRVDFVDGRFVFNEVGSGRFRATGAYSMLIDPLDFATAEGAPDRLVSLIVDHREVWLLGETSTEVWFNAGTSDFPFARVDGAYIEHGCAAAQSVAKIDNSVFWLGADENGRGVVLRAIGYQPQRISTHALEYALAQYARIDDAIAWTYQQEGHSFYVLTFPSADVTWVYDAAANLWHERAWRGDDGALHRHRAASHMAFAGANIVGDWQTGKLYRLDLDTHTDDGAAIARIRQAPHLSADGKRVFHAALQIDMETGTGFGIAPYAGPGFSEVAALPTLFQRASAATYVDAGVLKYAVANEPRYQDGVLLLEGEATNLLKYSQEFDNAYWVKQQATVTANAAVAPDGTLTAYKLVATAVANFHQIYPTGLVVTAGNKYVYSVYVEAAEYSAIELQINAGTGGSFGTAPNARFDLTTGTTSNIVNCTASIVSVGNGWYRCSIVTNAATSTGTVAALIQLYNGGESFLGDGTSGVYLWGAQLEAVGLTSYVPTAAAIATRAADIDGFKAPPSRVYLSGERRFYDIDYALGWVRAEGEPLPLVDENAGPRAMLQWSDDGGATWSNERWASIGKIGERRARVRWRRLGQARDRVYRVTITDPVKVAIVGATIEAAAGAS